jgi:dipeptidyl aminopeptidase/acylaminoacyl peptidase
MTDLVIDYETTRPDLRPYSEEMMGGRPDEVPERYYERSPINFVQDIQGRLLIIQGMQDPNVTPQNVTVVREKLDNAGVEYGVLAFDDEGHGIIKTKNQKRLYMELAQFFESAFGGD